MSDCTIITLRRLYANVCVRAVWVCACVSGGLIMRFGYERRCPSSNHGISLVGILLIPPSSSLTHIPRFQENQDRHISLPTSSLFFLSLSLSLSLFP